MRLALALAVSALALACLDDELVAYCAADRECWTDTDGVLHVDDDAPRERLRGACHTGVTRCAQTDAGPVATCAGEIRPGDLRETCNGVDDDCDGPIDESLYLYASNPDNPCPRRGECGTASLSCLNGVPTCNYQRVPVEEICDCRDNDCDGEFDEGFDAPTFFYPTEIDPATVGVGECRPGVVSACTECEQTITPPIVPVAEICGNGADDDCDGFTDEPRKGREPRAFALVLDVSGSMGSRIAAVADAVCAWSTDFADDGTRFAVVTVGAVEAEPGIALRQDFADAVTTCATLQSPGAGAPVNEYMLEGVAIGLLLDWPLEAESRRHVIAFGDETQQYYVVDEADIVEGCALVVGATLDAFVPTSRTDQWDDLTAACGGYVSNLDDASGMISALRERFAGGC